MAYYGKGTATQVLTDNTAPNMSNWKNASGGSSVNTLTGNSGVATASSNNINVQTANATVRFVGSAATLLEDFGLSNLLMGSSGSAITSAANNVGLGLGALTTLTSGQENIGSGVNCLNHITQGSNNCGYGTATLAALTTSISNSSFGHNSGQLITTGSGGNTSAGYQSLSQVLTGSFNSSFGYQAGRAYTSTESNNISIGNGVLGTVGESGITRIGANQSACFIDGIDGVNVGSVARVVTEASDQLGTAILTAGTGITITPSANVITISASTGTFPWTDVSGAFSPLAQNGYFITGTATGTLPAAPTQGQTIQFFVDTTQFLTIQASGTQIIRLGSLVTSAGGTAISTLQGDSIELVYRASNTSWQAVDFVGTWLIA